MSSKSKKTEIKEANTVKTSKKPGEERKEKESKKLKEPKKIAGSKETKAQKKIKESKKAKEQKKAKEPKKVTVNKSSVKEEISKEKVAKEKTTKGKTLKEKTLKEKQPLKKELKTVDKTLKKAGLYRHAAALVSFDLETICPKDARQRQGELDAFLGNEAFKLMKKDKFIKAGEALYKNRGELDKRDAALAKILHRSYMRTKNITPKMQKEFSLIYNKAYLDWLEAKEKNDFSVFAPSLNAVRNTELKSVSLREDAKENAYDNLLDDYERGMTGRVLDKTFNECKERLIPLLKKIKASKKKIRTDFLRCPVNEEAQRKMTRYLLEIMRYDFNRGCIATTEHPFTSDIARDDVRITTHYHEGNFTSNMFTVIHEGGHALFGQNVPRSHHKHHVAGNMTLGMHESVSRFYENRIGRTREFVNLIYGKAKELFADAMKDVSADELYEALNTVQPSLIRTEADEFTYTFHIIIRYELEKEIINGGAKIEDLPKMWDDKYEEYLGIRPTGYSDGILQDVHWSSGFGYFPTYALGNMYNAMYFNKMHEKYNIEELVEGGHIDIINDWMKKHVFKKAELLDADEWIEDITGRKFTPKDFLDYLENKYGEIYGL